MRKVIFLAVFTICFSASTNAQFLKKLGDKIEEATERKAGEKTTKESEEILESTSSNNTEKEKKAGFPGLSNVAPAESYAFNHKIEMQITSGKEVVDVDYLIPDSGNFLGISIEGKKGNDDLFTVYDIDREAMFTYMENNGDKMKMGMEYKSHDAINENAYTIKATGKTKTILGYNCLEYLMTGEDMTATVWVTTEVDIRFPSDFHKIRQKKSNNQSWMENIEGWAMEMEMIDTSKRKPKTTTMNCLSINKSDFKIDSKDYKKIGF